MVEDGPTQLVENGEEETNKRFSPLPVLVLLFVPPSPAQSPPVTLAVRTFRYGAQMLAVTNNSSQPLTGLALRCPARATPRDPRGPEINTSWDDSAWNSAFGTLRNPWHVAIGGWHLYAIQPGQTKPLLFDKEAVAACLRPGMSVQKLFGAAIFADGSSAGDEQLVQGILHRRKLAYHSIETAIQMLNVALESNESRSEAIRSIRELQKAPGCCATRDEWAVSDRVFGLVDQDLRLSKRVDDNDVPPAQAIDDILGILQGWRKRLLASKPVIQ